MNSGTKTAWTITIVAVLLAALTVGSVVEGRRPGKGRYSYERAVPWRLDGADPARKTLVLRYPVLEGDDISTELLQPEVDEGSDIVRITLRQRVTQARRDTSAVIFAERTRVRLKSPLGNRRVAVGFVSQEAENLAEDLLDQEERDAGL